MTCLTLPTCSEKTSPHWPNDNTATKVHYGGTLGLTGPGRRPRPPTRLHLPGLPIGAAFRSATTSLAGWLASLPHRVGARLFAMNDTEAGWRGWEITELRCGLARSYHDPRFDLLRVLRTLDPQTPGRGGLADRGPAQDRPSGERLG